MEKRENESKRMLNIKNIFKLQNQLKGFMISNLNKLGTGILCLHHLFAATEMVFSQQNLRKIKTPLGIVFVLIIKYSDILVRALIGVVV